MTLLVLILLGCVAVTRLFEKSTSINCASSTVHNAINIYNTNCAWPQRRDLRKELLRFKRNPRFKDALLYNIPQKMEEFKRTIEQDFGVLPTRQPRTTYMFDDQKKRCMGYWHEDYSDICRKTDVLTYSKWRYPRRMHEYKCCPVPKDQGGHCRPVKIPVHVLKIIQRQCPCVVWDFYFKTVGCSFEPDNSTSFRSSTAQ